MSTTVINSQLYSNPYQALLYSALEGRYTPMKGGVSSAIDEVTHSGKGIFHIHWEEAIFRGCPDRQAGRNKMRRFLIDLRRYKDSGGTVIWTVHNIKPHDRGHHGSFFEMRRQLALIADQILLHNAASVPLFAEQVDLPLDKVIVLPHPSYLDVYEAADSSVDAQVAADSSTLLVFGRIKTYKKAHALLNDLNEEFLLENALHLKICGEAGGADKYVEKLKALISTRTSVTLDARRVPNEEVAPLFRAAKAVVIPYEKVFSSGVAVLCLTLGVPAIAPRTPQMLELFPEMAHSLFYTSESPEDLRRAILELKNWDAARRQQYLEQAHAYALAISPHTISLKLGALYDDALASTSLRATVSPALPSISDVPSHHPS